MNLLSARMHQFAYKFEICLYYFFGHLCDSGRSPIDEKFRFQFPEIPSDEWNNITQFRLNASSFGNNIRVCVSTRNKR